MLARGPVLSLCVLVGLPGKTEPIGEKRGFAGILSAGYSSFAAARYSDLCHLGPTGRLLICHPARGAASAVILFTQELWAIGRPSADCATKRSFSAMLTSTFR
jgi:hypothetical protein